MEVASFLRNACRKQSPNTCIMLIYLASYCTYVDDITTNNLLTSTYGWIIKLRLKLYKCIEAWDIDQL